MDVEKSLDEVIVEQGGSLEEAPRGNKGKGAGRKGLPPSAYEGAEQFSPFGRKGGKKGKKGGKKGKTHGVKWRPDVNEPWLHDQFKDGHTGRQFYKTADHDEQATPGALDCKVHMQNVPWDWGESDLKEVFDTVVSAQRVSIYYDGTGRNSGSGMATFSSPQDAAKIIEELNGAKLGAKELILTPAKVNSLRSTGQRSSGFGEAVSKWRPGREIKIRLLDGTKVNSNGDVAPAKTVDSMNDQLLQYTAQAEKEKADQLAQQQKQQQEQQEQPPQEAAAAEEGAMEADADEGDEPEIS